MTAWLDVGIFFFDKVKEINTNTLTEKEEW